MYKTTINTARRGTSDSCHGHSSSFSAFPARSLGFTISLVRFLCMCPFFDPTIEAITFFLPGWCLLGVFLLPAFICLGHECQDLLSLCDGMPACTD